MASPEEVAAGLREWAAGSPADEAAVGLLEWKGWLRRADFTAACTWREGADIGLDWGQVREFAESGPRASSSELAILRLAITIGEDDLGLKGLGHAHRRAAVEALAGALGVRAVIEEDHGPQGAEEIPGTGLEEGDHGWPR